MLYEALLSQVKLDLKTETVAELEGTNQAQS
jgi:hypothetical protein